MLRSKQKGFYQRISREKSRVTIMLTLLIYYLCNSQAYANTSSSGTAGGGNKISSSTVGKGLVNMFNDASTFLLILSPLAGGAFALYFLMRKNAADDQDQKQWNRRLINTGICTAGAVLVTGIISLVTSYFQQTA